MRIKIVSRGNVVPGMERAFRKLVLSEIPKLKQIWESDKRRFPEDYKGLAEPDWEEDSKKSLIAAAFRLGNGDIWVEV